jgi:hypothetical protein
MVKELECPHIAGRYMSDTASLENSLAVSQNMNYRISIWLRNSTPWYTAKRIENTHSETCTQVVIEAIIPNSLNVHQPMNKI